MIITILEGNYQLLYLLLGIIVVCWGCVVAAIGIDLYFGVKKSKQNRVTVTHSFGFRRTSEKVVQYLAFMFFMLLIDVLNPIFAYFSITHLPLASIFGAIVLVYTEWKSVHEKADQKFRNAIQNNPTEIIKFIQQNRELIEELQKKKENE